MIPVIALLCFQNRQAGVSPDALAAIESRRATIVGVSTVKDAIREICRQSDLAAPQFDADLPDPKNTIRAINVRAVELLSILTSDHSWRFTAVPPRAPGQSASLRFHLNPALAGVTDYQSVGDIRSVIADLTANRQLKLDVPDDFEGRVSVAAVGKPASSVLNSALRLAGAYGIASEGSIRIGRFQKYEPSLKNEVQLNFDRAAPLGTLRVLAKIADLGIYLDADIHHPQPSIFESEMSRLGKL